MRSKILRAGYALAVLKGLGMAVAPRRAIKLDLQWLKLCLDNVGELEPRDWYVTMVRATGVGMVAAGGIGLLLTDDESPEPTDETVEPITIDPDDPVDDVEDA